MATHKPCALRRSTGMRSGLSESNTSQVKLIWIWASAILCGVSGFWLISPRASNQAESDRAILAETSPTMTPEEGTNQSAPVPEVRRAELVISPQVRRAELVKLPTKENHQESKEDTVGLQRKPATDPDSRESKPVGGAPKPSGSRSFHPEATVFRPVQFPVQRQPDPVGSGSPSATGDLFRSGRWNSWT
jgi:hypothetical protein